VAAIITLALDPGATVGWAKYEDGEGYASGEISCLDLWPFLETYRLTRFKTVVPLGMIVVYEKFDRRSTAVDLIAVECIGILKEWARQHRGVTLEEQSASMAKFFWSDEKLKALGLYRIGKPHACDAVRHILYYAYFNKRGPRLTLGQELHGENLP
jgi:hypothetical protein